MATSGNTVSGKTVVSRGLKATGFIATLLLATCAIGVAYSSVGRGDGGDVEPISMHVPSASYGPQKVVYHVSTRGSWRDRESEAWRLIAVANNHINAVEPEPIDLRIVFQGDGIDALERATSNPKLAAAFDALRKRGVKLLVCANTLNAHRVRIGKLHGVSEADLVPAAVAEFIRLQQSGFGYIKF
jgi:uncharacterized protein